LRQTFEQLLYFSDTPVEAVWAHGRSAMAGS
jgi:hypothetical protein